MAYVNIYYAEWSSPNNLQGYLYIDQLDYSGGATKLVLKADSISINYNFEDWNNPVIGIQCEFEIINDKLDFYELLPLLTAEEREYKVRVVVTVPSSYSLFEGFLNCDTITQKMLHRQIIKFAASSYLLKLEELHPVSIDTLQNKTFIDIIDEILTSTGSVYNIRINSKLHAEGDQLETGQTLFNKNGFYTELFWEDEITRASSLVVLKAILTSFDCYIYWWQGFWYIERYEDIWSESVDFVEYTSGTSYLPDDIGTVVHIDQVITDVHDLVFTEQSQTLSVIPGLKTIKINLEDKRVFNLVLSSLKGAIPTVDTVPAPDYRTFQIYQEQTGDFYTGDIIWTLAGLPKYNIANAIQKLQITSNEVPKYRGIFTTFKVTIDKSDVAINIKFKYFLDLTDRPNWTKKWEDYNINFYWFLRIAGTSDYIINSGEDWMTKVGPSSGELSDDENGVLQVLNIGGSSFDPANKTVEVSLTIPVGLVKNLMNSQDNGLLTGDQTLVFGLGSERLQGTEGDWLIDEQVSVCFLGDFNITSTGGLQSNVIEANITASKFLNKKDISMLLYDMESYSYKNGILRGDTLLIRTEKWGTTTGEQNITHKGVCWKTSTGPTISDNKTDEGTGFDPYVSKLVGLTPATTYYVKAYTIDESGTVSYGNELSFTTTILQIGSHFQGGIIFYFLQPDDIGYDVNIRKGLIAASEDQSSGIFWGSLASPGPYSPGAYGTAIGTGLANTELIAAHPKQYEFAVKKCVDYVVGVAPDPVYDDWYFPSLMELNQMKIQKSIIGGFNFGWYWSSSEPDPAVSMLGGIFGDTAWRFAWAVEFGSEQRPLQTIKKNYNFKVRAIRSFVES